MAETLVVIGEVEDNQFPVRAVALGAAVINLAGGTVAVVVVITDYIIL